MTAPLPTYETVAKVRKRKPRWVKITIGVAAAFVLCTGIGTALASNDDPSGPSISPTSSSVPATSSPASKPSTTSAESPATTPSTVYYANCDAVRAAHKAPLHRGDPGYRAALDRDNDGLACE
jgi:micrococcal nuclease